MKSITISRHAETRMRQRGLHESDISLILQYGSAVANEVYFLSQKAAEHQIRERKQEIHRLERLRDAKVVLADQTIVTAYRPNRRERKRMLRGQREWI